MNLISRADASKKIREHWLTTLTPEQLLAQHEPSWDRLRNYELEGDLRETFGGEWCINEWCPFDDVYCRWVNEAPDSEIEEMIRLIEANAENWRARGRNHDYVIAYIRDERKKACVR